MKNIIFLYITFCSTTLFSQQVDTLIVYQNNSTVFNAKTIWIQRPCEKAHWETNYELKAPKDNTYYLIYNAKKLLTEEGLYTDNYEIDSKKYNGFFNSNYYHYKSNGKLVRIHYQKDGRTVKTEVYKRGKLKETKLY